MLHKLFFLCLLFLFSQTLFAQQISGIVLDSASNVPMPFATVSFKNQLTGTVTNDQGKFSIINPDKNIADTLQVSFMGYKTFTISTANINDELTVVLVSKTLLFDEILIKPKEPTWYIKQAIKNRNKNYPQSKFETLAYYNEVIKENDHYTKFTEAFIKSNQVAYTDTAKGVHQLLLFRTADNIEEMQFMKDKMEKQDKKKRKKAEKKGEAYDEKSTALIATFGGPNSILELDLIKTAEDFLDSTKFKKYNYAFEGASTYKNKDVIIIGFQSKRTLDHQKQKGKIYIDTDTDAIVGFDYRGDIVIPALIRPFLFAMGLKIDNPILLGTVRFKRIREIWYPEIFQLKVNGDITKKYTFKKNEFAKFEIEQVLSINRIKPGVTTEISKEKQFDAKKEMPGQVHNDEGINWSGVNVVKVSY